METLFIAFILSYCLVIWFRTNAFAEYMTLLRLSRFFKIDEYNKLHNEGYDGVYLNFLHEYYRELFLVRLLSCPVCVSFWLGVLDMVISQDPLSVLTAPLTLFFYLLFNKML